MSELERFCDLVARFAESPQGGVEYQGGWQALAALLVKQDARIAELEKAAKDG